MANKVEKSVENQPRLKVKYMQEVVPAMIKEFGYKDSFSHVSTGGGASLEMIENDGHLPGVDILK